MLEGIIAGVITFIICQIIALFFKRSKTILTKSKFSIRRIKMRLKGEYSIGDIIKFEKIPKEKRTKRQQKAVKEAYRKLENCQVNIGESFQAKQAALKDTINNLRL